MSRPVAGLACRIHIPVRQYQAVALVVRENAHIIRLMHRDTALSIDVEQFDSFDTAEEYRDRLASFLDLPSLMLAGAGASPEAASSSAQPVPRRTRAVRARRPRFLTRRHTGDAVAIRKVDGREIIARS